MVDETEVTKEKSVVKEVNIIKEIEKILVRNQYKKFRQLGFPGESKSAYIKGNEIITVSHMPDAIELQIQAIKTNHRLVLGIAREKANERIVKANERIVKADEK